MYLQKIHDNINHWNDTGLNETGVMKLKILGRDFNLNTDKLKAIFK